MIHRLISIHSHNNAIKYNNIIKLTSDGNLVNGPSEQEIELAAKNSNVDEITELGKRYEEISVKLDEAVKNWEIS